MGLPIILERRGTCGSRRVCECASVQVCESWSGGVRRIHPKCSLGDMWGTEQTVMAHRLSQPRRCLFPYQVHTLLQIEPNRHASRRDDDDAVHSAKCPVLWRRERDLLWHQSSN